MAIFITYIIGSIIVLFLFAVDAFKGTNPSDKSFGLFLLALIIAQIVLLAVIILLILKRNKEYAKARRLHKCSRSLSEGYVKTIYAGWSVVATLQVPAIASLLLAIAAPKLWPETASSVWLIVGIVLEGISALFLLVIRHSKLKKAEEDKKAIESDADIYADALYENKDYTYDTACEEYCKQYQKEPNDLTADDQKQIEQYMYDDFAYLLMWIIDNNFYCTKPEWDLSQTNSMVEFVAKIRNRENLPTEYLAADGIFTEKEIKKKARDFVKKYYEGEYEAEMETYAKEHLKAQMYGFPFRWEDYDSFKPIIDAAYEKYAATKNK